MLSDIRTRFRTELSRDYPREEIDQIFHLLTAHFFDLPKTALAMEPLRELTQAEARLLLESLDKLKQHLPVQYITGRAPFLGMELSVTPAVLIPRPETEELVHWILRDFGNQQGGIQVLDIGTGSGCIALGVKKHLREAVVHALDLSGGALEVARANAEAQQLELQFHRGDICDPGETWPSFDLIVSNPPYVPLADKGSMEPHVTESEPHLALFVPDGDPLKFYRCICRFARRYLKADGRLYLEVHKDYGNAVAGLLEANDFADIVLKKDIFGRDRMISARWTALPSRDGKG